MACVMVISLHPNLKAIMDHTHKLLGLHQTMMPQCSSWLQCFPLCLRFRRNILAHHLLIAQYLYPTLLLLLMHLLLCHCPSLHFLVTVESFMLVWVTLLKRAGLTLPTARNLSWLWSWLQTSSRIFLPHIFVMLLGWWRVGCKVPGVLSELEYPPWCKEDTAHWREEAAGVVPNPSAYHSPATYHHIPFRISNF